MRKTSEVTNTTFPYSIKRHPLNTYIAVYKTGEVIALGRCNDSGKSDADILFDASEGLATIYISWVGQWRTDVFECDTISDMLKANI